MKELTYNEAKEMFGPNIDLIAQDISRRYSCEIPVGATVPVIAIWKWEAVNMSFFMKVSRDNIVSGKWQVVKVSVLESPEEVESEVARIRLEENRMKSSVEFQMLYN